MNDCKKRPKGVAKHLVHFVAPVINQQISLICIDAIPLQLHALSIAIQELPLHCCALVLLPKPILLLTADCSLHLRHICLNGRLLLDTQRYTDAMSINATAEIAAKPRKIFCCPTRDTKGQKTALTQKFVSQFSAKPKDPVAAAL